MIIDTLANAGLYGGMNSRLAAAFDYLRKNDFNPLADGRYDLDGDRLFALVQRYDSKPRDRGKWEAHRKYIDVQYIVQGIERMGYANVKRLKVTQPYDEKGDCELFDGPGDFLTCPAGAFMVFAPADAHMPGLAVTKPEPVIKVVVKVKI